MTFLSFYLFNYFNTNVHSLAWMIFWILDDNALTGPLPSELGLLTELTDLWLGKSILSSYLFNFCYEYILIRLDAVLDFR
jgi:hypothetical protein